jgi:hypothetical protein
MSLPLYAHKIPSYEGDTNTVSSLSVVTDIGKRGHQQVFLKCDKGGG